MFAGVSGLISTVDCDLKALVTGFANVLSLTLNEPLPASFGSPLR
jgi:hypothetical protein